ncbi:hypothetical protein ACNQO8_00780 [Acinetobacter calcoaceticus]|uniref:hypothetical protein n=1 Tax=Acinetobacter calcoaceticus TaxID=471 RepID=UPI003F7C0BEE
MKIILLLFCILLVGCTTPDKVLRIRSIGTITNPSVGSENNGNITGLKALTDNAKNTNIVLIHGIGWTQEQSNKRFGDDLVNVILMNYKGATKTSEVECPNSTIDGKQSSKKQQGLTIYSSLTDKGEFLSTDDPKLSIKPYELGCLDKVVINVGQEKTITIYRFLWDDAMWNSIEWKQIGYDDTLPPNAAFTGLDDPNKLRANLNARLKESIVTYGFSDAAMYMSPVGAKMREGVQAALCVALSNSFDTLFAKEKGGSEGKQIRADEMCANTPTPKSPLLLISHSLGSRIAFDTLKTDLSDVLAKKIEEGVSNDTIELHMLANQLPLIGLGRMGAQRSANKIYGKNLRLVAYSEINDLLTFELVPYFEQMCYTRGDSKNRCNIRDSGKNDLNRKLLVNDLGFDAVDIRLTFAPNLFKFYSGFKDPKIAHSGYLMSSSAVNILLCGVNNGKPNKIDGKCLIK